MPSSAARLVEVCSACEVLISAGVWLIFVVPCCDMSLGLAQKASLDLLTLATQTPAWSVLAEHLSDPRSCHACSWVVAGPQCVHETANSSSQYSVLLVASCGLFVLLVIPNGLLVLLIISNSLFVLLVASSRPVCMACGI